ncbi:hypothetical protein [Paludifilum halophilum]|uniref:PTS EIIA type-1 domain-containing protein n=1 Tax=Paludifilum halophilum TaxID=1642702 RepID=A0A235B1Z3_9BACL|nr:hypothetical protein [Paludifilum halophilum]OYD05969.1 hypothetical protein CHM34_18835 [Paludifilum halophilum]
MKAGDQLLTVDLKQIEDAGLSTITPVIITSAPEKIVTPTKAATMDDIILEN